MTNGNNLTALEKLVDTTKKGLVASSIPAISVLSGAVDKTRELSHNIGISMANASNYDIGACMFALSAGAFAGAVKGYNKAGLSVLTLSFLPEVIQTVQTRDYEEIIPTALARLVSYGFAYGIGRAVRRGTSENNTTPAP